MGFNKYKSVDVSSTVNLVLINLVGSCMGTSITLQIFSGIILSFKYYSSTEIAFLSVESIRSSSFYGEIQKIHGFNASVLISLVYIHRARGIFFRLTSFSTWYTGLGFIVLIYLLVVSGYILPYSKLSSTAIRLIYRTILWIHSDLGKFVINMVCEPPLRGRILLTDEGLLTIFMAHVFSGVGSLLLLSIHISFLHKNGSSQASTMAKPGITTLHPGFTIWDLVAIGLVLGQTYYGVKCYPIYPDDSLHFINSKDPDRTLKIMEPHWYVVWIFYVLTHVTRLRTSNNSSGLLGRYVWFIIIMFATKPCKENKTPIIAGTLVVSLFLMILVASYHPTASISSSEIVLFRILLISLSCL